MAEEAKTAGPPAETPAVELTPFDRTVIHALEMMNDDQLRTAWAWLDMAMVDRGLRDPWDDDEASVAPDLNLVNHAISDLRHGRLDPVRNAKRWSRIAEAPLKYRLRGNVICTERGLPLFDAE